MRTSPRKIKQQQTTDKKSCSLVLHNDNKNTFEFIIETLVDLCHHDPYQASQCAIIAHYKGKCEIKKGEFNELELLAYSFENRGVSVSIE